MSNVIRRGADRRKALAAQRPADGAARRGSLWRGAAVGSADLGCAMSSDALRMDGLRLTFAPLQTFWARYTSLAKVCGRLVP